MIKIVAFKESYSTVLFFCYFILIIRDSRAQDPEKPNTDTWDEYDWVSKSIPTIFEYIMETLQKQPQILEKDDVTTFDRNSANDPSIKDGKEISFSDVMIELQKLSDALKLNDEPNENFENFTDSTTESSEKDRVKRDVVNFLSKLNKLGTEISEKDIALVNYIFNFEQSEIDEDEINYVGEASESVKFGEKMNVDDVALAMKSIFNISPEEIESNTLMVEEMLEKHNYRE